MDREPNIGNPGNNQERQPDMTEITLKGRNLGEIKTRYFGDMQHIRSDIDDDNPNGQQTFHELNPEQKQIISQIEAIYQESNSSENTINSLVTDQEGKVVLNKGQIFHKINKPQSGDFDDSKMLLISKYGILASEWFGLPESEDEARFCSFFDTFEGDKKIINTDEYMVTIDYQNPGLQRLLKLDFFKYLEIKTRYPELVSQRFSKEELAMLRFIEKLSPGGKDVYKFHPNWKAIPSGILSKYINGICIDGPVIYAEKVTEPGTYFDEATYSYYQEISTESVKRLSELFPNATIFRRDRKVLHQPQENLKTNDLKSYETNP